MESIETSDKKANAKGAWPHLTKFDNETSHGTSLEKEPEWERRYEVK